MFIALALAVSARLNDAGRNRWIAIGAAVFIGVHAVFPKPVGASASNLFSAMYFVPLVLFLALLIWAGTRPEAPHLSTSPSVGPRTM
jgi:drug/metabolite transporter (DMT)-like permease